MGCGAGVGDSTTGVAGHGPIAPVLCVFCEGKTLSMKTEQLTS